VNDEITERTNKSGFDDCLDKLNAIEFQGTVKTYLNEFIINIIEKNIKNYSILEIMKRVIKDFDKKD